MGIQSVSATPYRIRAEGLAGNALATLIHRCQPAMVTAIGEDDRVLAVSKGSARSVKHVLTVEEGYSVLGFGAGRFAHRLGHPRNNPT